MKNDLIFNCLANDGDGYDKLSSMNQIKLQMFFLFMSIAIHRYDWKGLPKELPSWCLEKVVNLYGQGVIFEVGGQYLCTSAVNSSLLNIYGEPCEVEPVAINGMSFPNVFVKDYTDINNDNMTLVKQNGVLIKNNIFSIPTYALLKPYIEKLCFIWESAGINAGLSRIVALIHCNKDISGVVKSEIGRIMGGSKNGLAVINEKTNILDQIEKVDLKVEYTPDRYWLDFDNTFNKICELIGVTTDMNKAKKERVVVAQVESNDELTTIIEDTFLEYRKIGCKEMSSVFGLSVSVDNKVSKTKSTEPLDNKELGKNKEPSEEK